MIQKAAELISLALTAPTVVLGAGVVILWGKKAISYVFGDKTPHMWITLGVAVSFSGEVFDNSYWGIAWTAHFINSPLWHPLFEFGAFSNIPFRQVAGIVAAYCHLRAYVESAEDPEKGRATLNAATVITLGIGAFMGLALWRLTIGA